MQRADTEGTQINAAEVSRVCSLLLDELKQYIDTLETDDDVIIFVDTLLEERTS